MKRKIELAAFLLIAALIFIMALTVKTEAEVMVQNVPQYHEIALQVPPEDPHESEKIDAALDWHYIDGCELTAYCSCVECCGKDNGITATGTQAQHGVTIAVDPDVIPLGAWVEIDGHTYHAEDVGGGVNGNHIDVFFDSHDEAVEFGRQVANVRWYE